MKTTIKLINLISSFTLSSLIGIFACVYTSKIHDFFNYLEVNESGVKYSKIFIAVYIFSALLLLLSVLSLLMSTFRNEKINKIFQHVITVLNIILVITIVIFYLIIKLKTYKFLEAEMLETDFEMENIFYVDLFLTVLLQGICNIILSALGIKYSNDNEEPVELSSIEKETEPVTEVDKIKKEINDMKQALELQELKDEYLNLYAKMKNNENKK